MLIALDYDGTYSEDPILFNSFINIAKQRGHEIAVFTMRFPHEPIPSDLTDRVDHVYYTKREGKVAFAKRMKIKVGILIDDSPHFLLGNAIGFTLDAALQIADEGTF